ncbi:MAG: 3-deoxy-manno-octulosonate cytidylyltransferase [Sphingobium sp.]|nr:3-deoxy-manno-octulosonate cytidylyltransferase [Sphingobium sp.]
MNDLSPSARLAAVNTDVAIVIPTRYKSSRFPGKALTLIRGEDGTSRTLTEWTYSAALATNEPRPIFVATDDERIADVVAGFGGNALMTPARCANGTERIAACLDQLPDADLFVNLQGDALLTPPTYVDALIAHMQANPQAQVGTVAIQCMGETYRHLAEDAAQGRVGGTTVVLDEAGNALYFSKRILPYLPAGAEPDDETPVLLHLGLYAYRRQALRKYVQTGPTTLEIAEGLEQLRFLAHGIPVSVLVLPPSDFPIVEVNNPSDVPLVEGILSRRGRG